MGVSYSVLVSEVTEDHEIRDERVLAGGEDVSLEEFISESVRVIPRGLDFMVKGSRLFAPLDIWSHIMVVVVPHGDCSELTDEQFEAPAKALYDALEKFV